MYDVFAKLAKERGVNLSTVAKATGITLSTFTDWKAGRYTPKDDKRRKIAEYFGVSLEYLDTGEIPPIDDGKTNWVPVLGSVQAGIPIDAIEDILDYEQIDPALSNTGEYFGLRIKGDSMLPRICEGDVVIVRHQSTVENGDIAVVMVNGNEATVKKVSVNKNGMTLISYNPSFEPMVFSAEDVKRLPVRIIGKVVELRGKF